MERNPIGRDALVISAMCFIAGLVLAWSLAADPNGLHTAGIEWPAWVQAVGSLAGIAVAIAVPAWQKRDERRTLERQQGAQARNIAGALQPFIPAYRRRAAYLLRELEKNGPQDNLKQVPEESFNLPATIQDFHQSFHLLGEDGVAANTFVASLFWLQQGVLVIHRERLRDEARQQIMLDCRNTIAFAEDLERRLDAIVGRPNRLPD